MFNRVILIGRAGQDIDVRFTPGGTKVAKFSLATSRSFMDSSGNWQEKTQWHNITLWGRLADKAEKVVQKGKLFMVEGEIEYTNWEDNTGVKRYRTEIRALTLIPLSPRGAQAVADSMGQATESAPQSAPVGSVSSEDNVLDDLDKIEEPADDFEDDLGDDDVPF